MKGKTTGTIEAVEEPKEIDDENGYLNKLKDLYAYSSRFTKCLTTLIDIEKAKMIKETSPKKMKDGDIIPELDVA
ncbi:hypothetical protein M5689_020717 [Euphorbia peplus]|nr:hypothetical protein M5689_020717 [Euphorbia peplus]